MEKVRICIIGGGSNTQFFLSNHFGKSSQIKIVFIAS